MSLVDVVSIGIFLIFLIFTFSYLKKKIKKYNRILKVDGLDGIYFYFINKNYKNKGIWNFIDKKKYILGKKLAKQSKEKILFGPYAGTKFVSSYGWSNVDFGPKYLGTYEKQIQKKIIYLRNKFKIKFFVDCGAAEGYHIISLLKKKIFQSAKAFEIDENSRNILSKNAIINKVRKKISIFSEANFYTLKNNLEKKNLSKTLFLLDIEGSEFDLFDIDFCKYFSQSYFIVEDHNFLIVNKKKINSFYKNIYRYFKVEIIKGKTNDPLDYDILDNLTEDEKYLMMSEGRPKTMQWIVLIPR
tara:strand:+ start:453 stop:1352 length:900 start_codon:yes stop_codon:yes gene_type:complete